MIATATQPSHGPAGGGGKRAQPGTGAPLTPITPSSSVANLAALLNTPQTLSSQQLSRALGVGLPTPPGSINRGTVGLPTSTSGYQGSPRSPKPPNDPLFNPKNTTNVYVNNLPLHTADDALLRLCQPYGKVLSVRVFHREDAPVPGSYGFVLFETLEDARRCIVALHSSRYQASFAKTNKVPNPLLGDNLLMPLTASQSQSQPAQPTTESSSLYVRGLAPNTDQHTLELLFAPQFVVSFRLGEEATDGSIVWPTINKNADGTNSQENAPKEGPKEFKYKVALVRLKDHDTAEEMIDKLDGAYVRGSEAPLSVRFAEPGAWRRVGSNRPRNNFGPYSEEERLNDAGWVGVGLAGGSRVTPNPAFFNMGLGAMGIPQLHQQQIRNPLVGNDWINMGGIGDMNALNIGMLGGLGGLRGLQSLQGLQGLQGLNGGSDYAGGLLQSQLNGYLSNLGLSSQQSLTNRLAELGLSAGGNSANHQYNSAPTYFAPPQLQSPVSIRHPNHLPKQSPRRSNGALPQNGANNNANGTPMSRAPPPSPSSPQNARSGPTTVFTPQTFLSSLPSIPEMQEEAHQNQRLSDALAAHLLGAKAAVSAALESKAKQASGDKTVADGGVAHPTQLLTPPPSAPISTSQSSISPLMASISLPSLPEENRNPLSASSSSELISQGMPAQRPRTPARGSGVAVIVQDVNEDKPITLDLSAIMGVSAALNAATGEKVSAPQAPMIAAVVDTPPVSAIEAPTVTPANATEVSEGAEGGVVTA